MEIISYISSDKYDEVLCVIRDKGTETKKTISLKDYIRAVQDIQTNETVCRVGKLPRGFLDGGVNDHMMEAIIAVPAGKRTFTYLGKDYLIPFPELVFHFVAVDGVVNVSRCAVKDGEYVRPYPFGNVYNDMRICWGGNALPRLSYLKDFDKLVELFFSAGTNNDLYQRPRIIIDGKERHLDQRELVEYVSRFDTFPVEALRPSVLPLSDF